MEPDYIYSSTGLDVTFTEEDRARVRRFFETHAGQFFKASKVAKLTGLPVGNNQIKLRSVLTHLLVEEGCPITATSKGFCWVMGASAMENYALSLRLRAKGLQRRIKAVDKVAARMRSGDLTKYEAPPSFNDSEFCLKCGTPLDAGQGSKCELCKAADGIKKAEMKP